MPVSTPQLITARNHRSRRRFKVAASKTLHGGTLCFLAGGFATDVIAAGANPLAGVVVQTVDNSAGAAGDKEVEVWVDGDFELVGTGFSQATVGSVAYATDNYVVTATSASMTKIGRFVEFLSATRVMVALDTIQA